MNKASLFLWIFLIAVGIFLSGCGKVSEPEPFEPGYPHTYPRK